MAPDVHQGEIMGIPATGKQISFGGINLFRLENGKVVEDWVYVDLESITCSSHFGPHPLESIFCDGP
jgi:predicted ester cyclase